VAKDRRDVGSPGALAEHPEDGTRDRHRSPRIIDDLVRHGVQFAFPESEKPGPFQRAE